MALQADTYLLLHRMVVAAKTEEDLEIARKSFQAVVDENRGATSRDDRFDVAWSTSCLGGIYLRLGQLTLAEQNYLTAIKLFEENDMAAHSAAHSLMLAELYLEWGRPKDAENQLKANISYETKDWGVGSEQSVAAQQQLVHFQRTGEIVPAYDHDRCRICGISESGAVIQADENDSNGS